MKYNLSIVDDISVLASNMIEAEFKEFNTSVEPPQITPGMVRIIFEAESLINKEQKNEKTINCN